MQRLGNDGNSGFSDLADHSGHLGVGCVLELVAERLLNRIASTLQGSFRQELGLKSLEGGMRKTQSAKQVWGGECPISGALWL